MQQVIMNAVIKSATLGYGDRGILTSFVDLDYHGSGQGFGGFVLGNPAPFTPGKGVITANYCGVWVAGVLAAAEVADWSKLAGRSVRVRKNDEWGMISAIGHIIRDDLWFEPDAVFKTMQNKEQIDAR